MKEESYECYHLLNLHIVVSDFPQGPLFPSSTISFLGKLYLICVKDRDKAQK